MYLTRYASGDLCWLGLEPDWQGQLGVGCQKMSGGLENVDLAEGGSKSRWIDSLADPRPLG
jgi:hypothetical protein